jgi:lipoprotein-anchoring transpeptidase ErfK/SrfK
MTATSRRTFLAAVIGAAAVPVLGRTARAGNPLRIGSDPFYDQGLDAPMQGDPWSGDTLSDVPPDLTAPFNPNPVAMYARIDGDAFPVPAVKTSTIAPRFYRQVVPFDSLEPAGTIMVDPNAHHLYLLMGDGTAIRYGVGVGRSGFAWAGEATIHFKRTWPDWYPPKEMLDRQPELAEKMQTLQSGIGMPGGPGNPLGARALYLWQGNKDTLFRIHGTVEPWSIGHSVSSGCIRMINQDAIDLFGRVAVGTRVVVLGAGSARRGRTAGAG